MGNVTIPTAHGDVPMYVAEPPSTAQTPWPGVVVIHDILGMTSDARNQAEWLAGEGFLAAAPNLFHWGGRISCIRAAMRELKERKGRVFDEVEAVRAWLAGQPGCSGQVGVIGFCFGGGFALLLAPDHGFAASSVNYGRIPDDIDQWAATSCPVVGSFGATDTGLKGAAEKLDAALTKAGVAHDVKEYEGAGHSFLNQHEPSDVPMLLRMGLRLAARGGAGYHEEAAQDARKRIVAFLNEHLKKPK